jgi:hypothetical protein
MRRLEAPVRDKPGIDQHQRRALHQDVREIGSDIKKLQRRRAVTRYEAPLKSLWAVTDSAAHRNPYQIHSSGVASVLMCMNR